MTARFPDPSRFAIALIGGLFALAWLAAPDRAPPPAPPFPVTRGESARLDGGEPDDPVAVTDAPESPPLPGGADTAVAKALAEADRLPAPDAALAAAPLPPGSQATRLTVTAQRGDTLARLLLDAGVGRNDAQAVLDSLAGVFNPRDLKPGHEILLSFVPEAPGGFGASIPGGFAVAPPGRSLGKLDGVLLAATVDREVAVRALPDGGFTAETIVKKVNRLLTRTDGAIAGGSLMAAGTQAGVPPGVMIELIKILSFDVDFQRDIHPGDRFDLLYERFQLADGRLVRGGEVQYAALTLGGRKLRLYRYQDTRGFTDYYNELGHSVRKALLKTPIDGARLSSRFGMREHPILGYTTMHRGVDFAAPAGTPIYAAGDGAIAEIGDNGGYGRYVRVKHGNSYATAYAHMSVFARGLKQGSRVRQGQVIGYVGSTGRSTGPHLHYEVLRDGSQINPVSVKFPSGEKLAGAELARFRAVKAAVDRTLSGAPEQQASTAAPQRAAAGAAR
jgi:murein DD-endopeptidase MepM/ murein hydrolase activator NlpD